MLHHYYVKGMFMTAMHVSNQETGNNYNLIYQDIKILG